MKRQEKQYKFFNMFKLEDFKEEVVLNLDQVKGGSGYTASGIRDGRAMAMDYENDDCTLEVWYADGTKDIETCQ